MFAPSRVMPPETAVLFPELMRRQELEGFILIGGTALSLHIGHRISEDLDFITPTSKLPREALERLKRGLRLERSDNPAAYDEFLIAGMDLHDYSQSFVSPSGVKITFFTADPEHKALMDCPARQKVGYGEIASFLELCDLKAIVCASRSKSRDWLDMYLLAKDHDFTFWNWKEEYSKARMSQSSLGRALDRICLGKPALDDEGYKTLLDSPPALEEISAYFRKVRDEYEAEIARERAQIVYLLTRKRAEIREALSPYSRLHPSEYDVLAPVLHREAGLTLAALEQLGNWKETELEDLDLEEDNRKFLMRKANRPDLSGDA